MFKKISIKKTIIIFICTTLLLCGVVIFVWRVNINRTLPPTMEVQAANLQRLCLVWGFAKYTHQSFLMGIRCWDDELLSLIPVVRFADECQVNDILYGWFIGLGDDGYDLDWITYRSLMSNRFPDYDNLIIDFFSNTDNIDWPDIWELEEKLWLLSTGHELDLYYMTNLSWINEDYLGFSLYSVLSRFHRIQVIDRINAPIYFDLIGNSIFTNKNYHIQMCFKDSNYRLLGLFRLWNTMKYFFPYINIIDSNWNELLLSYIPKMIEGICRQSYELTFLSLTSNLHDAHIRFIRESSTNVFNDVFGDLYGRYFAPVRLTVAEGYLVVSDVCLFRDSPLIEGDVIRRLNGIDINDIAKDMLQYLPYPNDKKALSYLVLTHNILRQKMGNIPMEIEVFRDKNILQLEIEVFHMNNGNGLEDLPFETISPVTSHVVMENNIGLINPSRLEIAEVFCNLYLHAILSEFAYVDGLIIDLRQVANPHSSFIAYTLAEYLLNEQMHFVTISTPLSSAPGIFLKFPLTSGPGRIHDDGTEMPVQPFFFDKNIVILMNEYSSSNAEFTIMSLRNSPNAIVMGSNSIGANGNITRLPLPSGISMIFSGLGVFTPQSGQTQRIGLSPDIYVMQTVAGIRDGRDELMEAALQFLLEQLLS